MGAPRPSRNRAIKIHKAIRDHLMGDFDLEDAEASYVMQRGPTEDAIQAVRRTFFKEFADEEDEE